VEAYAGEGGMKFAYVDESGDQGQGDVFVMAGPLIDSYLLRKYTATFDEMIATVGRGTTFCLPEKLGLPEYQRLKLATDLE
jgi:hypothetical protein